MWQGNGQARAVASSLSNRLKLTFNVSVLQLWSRASKLNGTRVFCFIWPRSEPKLGPSSNWPWCVCFRVLAATSGSGRKVNENIDDEIGYSGNAITNLGCVVTALLVVVVVAHPLRNMLRASLHEPLDQALTPSEDSSRYSLAIRCLRKHLVWICVSAWIHHGFSKNKSLQKQAGPASSEGSNSLAQVRFDSLTAKPDLFRSSALAHTQGTTWTLDWAQRVF